MALLLIAVFFLCGRFLRGCVKGVLGIVLLVWLCRHHPDIIRDFWSFIDAVTRQVTEEWNNA